MQRCLQLANLGAGNVSPNPMVGAVLVHENRIIGEGYHIQYGEAHAEVNCINSVPDESRHLIKKSTLYVSLEPCNHFGKTPPCTDLIMQNEIPLVVIACADPFAKVNGTGIEKLQRSGVQVIQGILQEDALELNRRFFTYQQKKRPYIIIKWAQSCDLKIAGENYMPVKISNNITDRLVHKWRSEEAAIMVGTNTALYDNPSLTTRLWNGRNPLRVVVDKDLNLRPSLQLMDNSVTTIILNNLKTEERENNFFYKIKENAEVVSAAMQILNQHNIISLIVEGGAKLLQSFIDAALWDEARVITNKDMYIRQGIDASQLKDGIFFKKEILGTNEIIYFKRKMDTGL